MPGGALWKGQPLKVRVFASAQRAARALARDVAQRVAADPALVLGLPTGATPIPFYRELAALYRAGPRRLFPRDAPSTSTSSSACPPTIRAATARSWIGICSIT